MWMQQTATGNYQFFERYTDPYTSKERTTSVTLESKSAQAKKKAQKMLTDKIEKLLDKKTQTLMTFHESLDKWYISHQKALRPGSRAAYDAHIKIIKNYFDKDVLLANLDTRIFQDFFDSLSYSDQYILAIKSVINQTLDFQVRMRTITVNPARQVKLVRAAKTIDDYIALERKYLEADQAESLLKELYRKNQSYRIARLCEFMYLTGCRIGEATVLTEKDFDFENKTVMISGTLNRKNGNYKDSTKGPTKTPKGTRLVSLTDRCVDLAKRTILENKIDAEANEKYSRTGRLFVTKSGISMQVNSVNLSLKRAGKLLDLDKSLSSHIFRHTHISMLAELNIPIKAIMDRVGHEDSKITNKIYTHVTNNMKSNIITQLSLRGL